jgi:hypothetical protein
MFTRDSKLVTPVREGLDLEPPTDTYLQPPDDPVASGKECDMDFDRSLSEAAD